MSEAQRTARARYPNASKWPQDFSMAQGYAVCYEELVEPLKRALVECAIPYEGIRMDAGSRKWIAPEIWNAIIAATDKAREVLRVRAEAEIPQPASGEELQPQTDGEAGTPN